VGYQELRKSSEGHKKESISSKKSLEVKNELQNYNENDSWLKPGQDRVLRPTIQGAKNSSLPGSQTSESDESGHTQRHVNKTELPTPSPFYRPNLHKPNLRSHKPPSRIFFVPRVEIIYLLSKAIMAVSGLKS